MNLRGRASIPTRDTKFCLLVMIFLFSSALASADALLMTLTVDSSHVTWQEEFLLRLEIYGVPSSTPPQVTIDGMDQFHLQGQGKNLLQVPGGRTVKWVLTYTLIGQENGIFKLGPAKSTIGGRLYTS